MCSQFNSRRETLSAAHNHPFGTWGMAEHRQPQPPTTPTKRATAPSRVLVLDVWGEGSERATNDEGFQHTPLHPDRRALAARFTHTPVCAWIGSRDGHSRVAYSPKLTHQSACSVAHARGALRMCIVVFFGIASTLARSLNNNYSIGIDDAPLLLKAEHARAWPTAHRSVLWHEGVNRAPPPSLD